MSSPGPIPIPDGFTIEWEHPDDIQFFWSLDSMHNPHPISKLEDTFSRTLYDRGMNSALALYEVPIRAGVRRFWTYHYTRMSPLPLTENELQEMGMRSEERLKQTIAALESRWEMEWLPEIQAHIEHLDRYQLQDLPMEAMVPIVEDTFDRFGRLWEIHFEIVMPMMLAINLFDELYHDLFEPESPLAAFTLLQGLDNKTVEANNALWRLSRGVLASPQVRAVFETHAADAVVPALESTQDGQAFLESLNSFLDVYGRRGDTWGAREQTWIENPTTVILNLQDYIAQPDRNPELEQAGLVAERDRAIAEARERLKDYPREARDQFEFLLGAAQTGTVLSEDHGFWIDFRAMASVRSVFMQLGRRFAGAGLIDHPNDIFHLTVDEIQETVTGYPDIDRREMIRGRIAEIEHYATVRPPASVGTPPPGPPPDNPLSRTRGKFFGGPPAPSEDLSVLNGAAGSAGVVRGPAKVVHSLSDAGKIEPGDILVAPTTAPPWTPLFATVAAVVTDTGGILSHCAVVAREYGIPAVVGVGTATSVIRDGQTIEVNGDLGTVQIID